MSVTNPAADLSEEARALSPEVREQLRDLLLTLADCKRLLGIRYSDRMLGAPSLESGIAAASMAQDEWGHARLTYALLGDLGEDPARIEHQREPHQYRSMMLLDRPFGSWAAMIAANLVLDGALAVQYDALTTSSYSPVKQRVQKMVDEEMLHHQHAAGWVHRLAGTEAEPELVRELEIALSAALQWLGPGAGDEKDLLVQAGITSGGADDLRSQLLEHVSAVLSAAGLATRAGIAGGQEMAWQFKGQIDWGDWDRRARRSDTIGPDPETIARVRGDRNRGLLLD